MLWVHFPHPLLLRKIFTSPHHHFRCQRHLKTCTRLLLLLQIHSPGYLKTILKRVGSNTLKLLLERWGLDIFKHYWKGRVWIPWNSNGKARFGCLETILERGGWISWNSIGKEGFGYIETILERLCLDTLKLYWKGGVWISWNNIGKIGVWIPWNYIGKVGFGYLVTILERWGLDTL